MGNPTNQDILDALNKHVADDSQNFAQGRKSFAVLERVIFGDENEGEIGMKKKVDAIYDMMTQARGVGNFFGGIKGVLGFLIIVGGVIAIIKGWFN